MSKKLYIKAQLSKVQTSSDEFPASMKKLFDFSKGFKVSSYSSHTQASPIAIPDCYGISVTSSDDLDKLLTLPGGKVIRFSKFALAVLESPGTVKITCVNSTPISYMVFRK